MNTTQEKSQKVAQTSSRFMQLYQETQRRRELLLSYDNLLTCDADDVIAELIEIDATIAVLPQILRLHEDYYKSYLAGIRAAVV